MIVVEPDVATVIVFCTEGLALKLLSVGLNTAVTICGPAVAKTWVQPAETPFVTGLLQVVEFAVSVKTMEPLGKAAPEYAVARTALRKTPVWSTLTEVGEVVMLLAAMLVPLAMIVTGKVAVLVVKLASPVG